MQNRGRVSTHQAEHRLRNEPLRRFAIQAAPHAHGPEGTVIRAQVTGPDGDVFRYEIAFGGDYIATKAHFDAEMYLHMALSLVRGQIESHEHGDTRLSVHRESGLIESEPATFDWTEVA